MNTIPVRGLAVVALPLVLLACASQPAANSGDGPGTGGKTGGSSGGTKTGGTSGGNNTGGTSGGNTGGSSGGSGGNGTSGGNSGSGGGAPSGGSSGAGGSGPAPDGGTVDPPVNAACGWSGKYTGPLLGRCDVKSCTTGQCGIAVGKGGFLTLDDFEGATGPTATIGINWPAQDGRTGSWTQFASPPGQLAIAATDTAGGSPGSKQALHYSGPVGMFEATLALPMGSSCYDASAYDGISFWIKGNPGAGNDKIKFNVHTPVSEPKETGGACSAGCYDHFGKVVTITPGWTKYTVKWSDLVRSDCKQPTPPIPDGFEPHKQIVEFSFSVQDTKKGFDFWVDDMRFDAGSSKHDSFESILTEPIFNEMFKTPKAPYSFQGLVQAVKKYGSKWGGSLAGEGTDSQRQNEVAAFMGHLRQETAELTDLFEKTKATDPVYYGRGAMQLTHLANYQAAEAAGFAGIVAKPDKVIETADYAFGTAVWFWMTPQSAKGVCHAQILNGAFSRTTWIINGGIECGNPVPPEQASRVAHYKRMAAAIGINPSTDLECRSN